jgi:hypothetical protein
MLYKSVTRAVKSVTAFLSADTADATAWKVGVMVSESNGYGVTRMLPLPCASFLWRK